LSFSLVGSLLASLALAAVHVFFPRLERAAADRLQWLVSLASGAAIGYVFLYLLPKIGDYTAAIVRKEESGWEFFQYRLYLYALLGMLLFYFIDRARVTNPRHTHWLTWLHGIGFSTYSGMLGYLLPNVPRQGYFPYGLVALAFGLHLMGIDHQLRHWHRESFDRYMRWLMGVSVILGWTLGVFTDVDKSELAVWSSVLAGGILINVMNEELPDHKEGRMSAFLGGIGLIIVLGIIVRSLPRID